MVSLLQQPPKVRQRPIRFITLIAALVVVGCLQMMLLISTVHSHDQNNVWQPSNLHSRAKMEGGSGQNSNITFVGVSYSDSTVSDAGINYLLEAACAYSMESYILLSERDNKSSLDKKIYVLAQHWYMNLGQGGSIEQPKCAKLIHIDQAPSQGQLIHETITRMKSTGEEKLLTGTSPNNPLEPDNRIAKLKRVREYQRQMLRGILDNRRILHKINGPKHSVIAMLDLDMFGYPPLPQIIDVSEKYIIPSVSATTQSSETKLNAICANGLQRSRFGETRPHRSYYDTFSTVLLPNTWLHRESKRAIPRGGLHGENVTLSKMSQREMLNWFLSEGSRNNKGSYEPVPVRSCFGGLTLYQADTWLHSTCRYDLYNEDYDAYRGKQEQQTCEHIVFHECLRQHDDFKIAVQPDMLTLWHLM
jgi:hypothetical protein